MLDGMRILFDGRILVEEGRFLVGRRRVSGIYRD